MAIDLKALTITFAALAGGASLLHYGMSRPPAPEEGDIRTFSSEYDHVYKMILERDTSVHAFGGEQYAKTLQVTFAENSADISHACVLNSYDFYGIFGRDIESSPVFSSYTESLAPEDRRFARESFLDSMDIFNGGTTGTLHVGNACGPHVISDYQDELVKIAGERTKQILGLD